MLVLGAHWLYGKLGRYYFLAYLVFEVVSALIISVGTVGIFSLYQRMSDEQAHVIALFSWACVLIALAAGVKKVARSSRPLRDWINGDRDAEGAEEAWRTAVGLPLEFVTRQWWQPVIFIVVPVSIFIPAYLGLHAYSAPIIAAGTLAPLYSRG